MDVNPLRPQSAFNTQHDGLVRFLERVAPRVAQNPQETRLFPHQVEAVLRLGRYFDGDVDLNPDNSNTALVVLPTGCGKTGVAVLASYALNASRVLVITPSVVISEQIHGAYKSFLVDYKVTPEGANLAAIIPSRQLIGKSTELRDDSGCSLVVTNAHKVGGRSRVQINAIPNDRYDLVIVDEAHHYPAATWKLLVDHFSTSRKLFLTATPWPLIPEICPCFNLERKKAVELGIIRDVSFEEVDYNNRGLVEEEEVLRAIARRMKALLDQHDHDAPGDHKGVFYHQGMVLTQTKEGINSAVDFNRVYNELYPGQCKVYVGETSEDVRKSFEDGEIRVLVVVGRLLEGFDRKEVSVLGIVRNVALASQVLFAQFVGRAVRKINHDDRVKAVVVSHSRYNQRANFNKFDTLAEVDPGEED